MPDVVLLDVRMPKRSGLQACIQIKELVPSVKIIMLTVSDEEGDLYESVKNGASGYLLKDSSADDIVTGVREVHSGASSLSPRIASMLIKHVRDSTPVAADAAALEPLTEREVEVLHCLAQGMSNAEIAKALIVSEGTVKAHLGRMMSKWHLRDRVQILVTAAHAGLVSFR